MPKIGIGDKKIKTQFKIVKMNFNSANFILNV